MRKTNIKDPGFPTLMNLLDGRLLDFPGAVSSRGEGGAANQGGAALVLPALRGSEPEAADPGPEADL